MLAKWSVGDKRLNKSLILGLVILLATLALPLAEGQFFTTGTQPGAGAPGTTAPDLSRLPLSFEPNAGQTDPSVRFMARAPGGTLYFTPAEVVLSLSLTTDDGQRTMSEKSRSSLGSENVRLQFVGANPSPLMQSGDVMPGKTSYFLGNDATQWRTGLATYEGVTYCGLYPGVDLAYSGTNGNLKGTYTLAPGADPAAIRWRYAGVSSATVDKAGNLQLNTQGSKVTLTEHAPVAWQTIGGQKVPVEAGYSLANGTVGFALGRYNPTYPLIIDPTLTYSTFFGGTNSDAILGIKVDSAGNIYVSGATSSSNFPTANPYQGLPNGGGDVFVSKLDPTGTTLIYSTYLGGSSNEAEGAFLAIDTQGSAYVTGRTSSDDYPTLNAFQPTFGGYFDAFVTKLSPSGSSLVYSTYLGGSLGGLNDEDGAYGIAVDTGGNAYVVGETASINFPTLNAFQPALGGIYDAFVSKFGPTGVLAYSTYLGGDAFDLGMAIAVDEAGSAYVTGRADSENFPTLNPIQPNNGGNGDAFVTKLSTSGSSLVYSTYLGGNDTDYGFYEAGIAVDAAGNTYVGGETASPNFPTLNPYQPNLLGSSDTFLTKINPAGSALIYSTYFGGTSWESTYGLVADSAGNAYISGKTSSVDFPVANAIQATYGGSYDDAFVAQFPPDGSGPLFSTYLGGGGSDYGYDLDVDSNGTIYVGGYTSSNNFPVTAGAYQGTYNGSGDGFIARIDNPVVPTPTGTPPTATPRPPTRTNTPTITPTPYPCALGWNQVPSLEDVVLQDVTVLSPSNVWAAGYGDVGSAAVIAHWDGTQWSQATTPNPPTQETLYGIDAASANDIWAVGTTQSSYPYVFGAYILHWDGTQWTQVTVSNLPFYSSLKSVSVLSANDVWAVGTAATGNTNDYETLTLHWDGSVWSRVSSPSVENYDTILQSVHASAPDDVWAVGYIGYYNYDHTYNTLALHWDGTSWNIVSTPNPSSYNADVLYDVTATPDGDVWAVGYYAATGQDYFVDRPLLLHWNGSSWVQTASPLRGDGDHDITGVAAISSNDVWAVGLSLDSEYGGDIRTLTEHWNGIEWSIVNSPDAGGLYNYLYDVDALSSTEVWAVGQGGNIPDVALTLRYSDPCTTPLPTATGTSPTSTPTTSNTNTPLPTNPVPTSSATAVFTPVLPTATLLAETSTPTPEGTPEPCPIEFSDVEAGSTFYPFVRCLACQGILGGYDDGTFRPNNQLTRGQLAKIVANSAGFDDTPTGQTFEDVPGGHTFYIYIERMALHAVISGYQCGGEGEPCGPENKPYFRPDTSATRGQISKIVANSAQIREANPPDAEQMFEDVQPDNAFYGYVQALASRGIMSGYPCGGEGDPCGPDNMPYFHPTQNATRGQTAKIVSNTFSPGCNP
jgi:hypothetical protein